MTHIPRRLLSSIRVPRGNFAEDITLAQLDAEMEEDSERPTLLTARVLIRQASINLPREVTPRKLLGLGLIFGSLSTSPRTGTFSRAVTASASAGAIALAIDLKCLEETEQEDGVRVKPGDPGEETPLRASDWIKISALLGGAGLFGDAIGLDAKRRAAAMTGSMVTGFIGVMASMGEGIDQAALDMAQIED